MAQQSPPTKKIRKFTTVKTTCLFCTNLMLLKLSQDPELVEMYELLLHLCSKMELDTTLMPPLSECDEKRFPFCKPCMSLLKELWGLKDSADKRSLDQIILVLRKIQEAVFLGEERLPGGKRQSFLVKLKKRNPSIEANEHFKYMQLRSMILSARERLLLSKQPSAIIQEQIQPSLNTGDRPGTSQASGIEPSLEQPGPSGAVLRSAGRSLSAKCSPQEPQKEYRSVCERCGKLMYASRNTRAFQRHQFTHKNDEERGAAYDAKEVGASNCFLDPANKRPKIVGSTSALPR